MSRNPYQRPAALVAGATRASHWSWRQSALWGIALALGTYVAAVVASFFSLLWLADLLLWPSGLLMRIAEAVPPGAAGQPTCIWQFYCNTPVMIAADVGGFVFAWLIYSLVVHYLLGRRRQSLGA